MTAPRSSPRRTLPAVLGAQFLTSLADNALLILAIALLEQRHAPGWATPTLRIVFYGAYVLLAPLAGRLADRWRKGRLMTLVNLVKLGGALGLMGGAHPLLVFGAVGLGAATYAPARYGILPELAAGRALVRANAWMEIVTIVSILAGVALGSMLVLQPLLELACAMLAAIYGVAALCTLAISTPRAAPHAITDALNFRDGMRILLGDRAARNALALTSVFWSAAAVLQFVLIDWSRAALGLSLAGAAMLPGVLAIGMVGGALGAGHARAEAPARTGLILALTLSTGILLMPLMTLVWAAALLLLATGVLAGALLVPLNATLQARGASLMRPGLSVAVQNFFENGLSLLFLAGYGIALARGATANVTLYGLGIAVLVLVVAAASLPARARVPTPEPEV